MWTVCLKVAEEAKTTYIYINVGFLQSLDLFRLAGFVEAEPLGFDGLHHGVPLEFDKHHVLEGPEVLYVGLV